MTARRQRGRATELAVARWLKDHGWPFAEPTSAAAMGQDITGVPGVCIEVKARTRFEPLAWLKQATGRGGLPVAVMRCNGQGTSDPGQYVALMKLKDLVALLRAAGYGNPPDDRYPHPLRPKGWTPDTDPFEAEARRRSEGAP